MSTADGPVTRLPPGYPAYCVYFASGFGTDAENAVLNALKQWGTSMGQNLYVARWNIGDPSYVDISIQIGLRNVPAIVLTDTPRPSRESFMIVLDDPTLVNGVNQMRPALTMILQHILLGEAAVLLKDAMRTRDENQIRGH